MTVSELIELLEGLNPDLPVKVAVQPAWPLAATILVVNEATTDDGDPVVWIATDDARGYAAPDAY